MTTRNDATNPGEDSQQEDQVHGDALATAAGTPSQHSTPRTPRENNDPMDSPLRPVDESEGNDPFAADGLPVADDLDDDDERDDDAPRP